MFPRLNKRVYKNNSIFAMVETEQRAKKRFLKVSVAQIPSHKVLLLNPKTGQTWILSSKHWALEGVQQLLHIIPLHALHIHSRVVVVAMRTAELQRERSCSITLPLEFAFLKWEEDEEEGESFLLPLAFLLAQTACYLNGGSESSLLIFTVGNSNTRYLHLKHEHFILKKGELTFQILCYSIKKCFSYVSFRGQSVWAWLRCGIINKTKIFCTWSLFSHWVMGSELCRAAAILITFFM